MPLPGVVALTDTRKQAIIADKLAGLSASAIAAKHRVHIATISRIWCKFRKAEPLTAERKGSIEERKASLISPSFDAISRGLADQSTSGLHKAATLAVSVLKGVGVFQPDQQTSISLLASSVPAEWRVLLPKDVPAFSTATRDRNG